jgi:hypothetical protein
MVIRASTQDAPGSTSNVQIAVTEGELDKSSLKSLV